MKRAIKLADLLLVGGGIAAAIVAIYILYHYLLFGNRSFSGIAGWIFYLFVPASICVLLFLSLRLRTACRLAIAYSLAGVLISALVGELILAHKSDAEWDLPYWGFGWKSEHKRQILLRARQAGVDFDTRHVSTVVKDLQTFGIESVPFMGGAFMKESSDGGVYSQLEANQAELLPLGGVSDKLTIVCNQTGTFTTYKSDEHGFNNPRGIWSAGQVSIAALGQSFVQGFCAPAGKNFVDLIRNRHPFTVNLGHSGEGPLLQLGAVNEYLTILRPEVVLWFYLEGIDLSDLAYERKSRLAMRYLDDGFKQDLISRQNDIDQALTRYLLTEMRRSKGVHLQEPQNSNSIAEAIKLNRLRSQLGLVHGEKTNASSPFEEANVKLFSDILTQANGRVGNWGGRLYLVYLPSWKRFGANSPLPDQERALVHAAAQASKISMIDAIPGFNAHKDPLSLFPFRVFGHYNEEGHQIVANQVLKSITVNKSSRGVRASAFFLDPGGAR